MLYVQYPRQTVSSNELNNMEILSSSSCFLVRPKRVEYLPGKSQSVNTLLKHQSK